MFCLEGKRSLFFLPPKYHMLIEKYEYERNVLYKLKVLLQHGSYHITIGNVLVFILCPPLCFS